MLKGFRFKKWRILNERKPTAVAGGYDYYNYYKFIL